MTVHLSLTHTQAHTRALPHTYFHMHTQTRTHGHTRTQASAPSTAHQTLGMAQGERWARRRERRGQEHKVWGGDRGYPVQR